MKIIIDTNLWISFLLKGRACKDLLAVLSFILQKAQIYPLYNIPHRCRDPKDDYLLELAVVSEADYLLTGDDDLLSMHTIGKCNIITVAECRQCLITM